MPEVSERHERLKIGFIGGGINSAVGRAHYCATAIDGLYELVAGCFSRSPEINHQSAIAYGVPPARTFSSWQQLIDAEAGSLDAIIILTPTSDHLAPLLACMERRLPIICEKAMTATVCDAERVAAAMREYKAYVAVTYNYTGYPAVRELRSIIQRGTLGRLIHFSATMPQEGFLRRLPNGAPVKPQDWRLSDGPIPTVYLDLGVHLHQIMYYLLGRQPVSVNAVQASFGNFPGIIDYVSAVAEFSDGIIGNYYFGKSMLGHRNGLRVEIFGTEASLSWEQMRPEEIRISRNDGRVELIDRSVATEHAGAPRYTRFKAGHPAGYVEAFANLYADIHAELLTGEQPQSVGEVSEVFGPEFAVSGLRVMQAMANSAVTGASVRL